MENLNKLKGFIIEKARLCLHNPEDKLKFPYVTPSFEVEAGADDKADVPARSLSGHYLQMYDWDACFFSQASHRAKLDYLAVPVIENFLSFQNSDGYIPRTISPHRIWDGYDLAKPFLAQTLAHYLTQEASEVHKEILANYIQRLASYLNYFDESRLDKSGLYHWRNVLESGVDNNLCLLAPGEAAKDENNAVGNFPDGQLLACDLNSYLVSEFLAFSKLANLCGNSDLSQQYEKKAAQLTESIESYLWNEELNIYCNFDPSAGKQIEIRCWTGLTPVLFSVANPERTQQVIETNILHEEHFLRPAGIASVAASEPLYNQAKRGLYGSVIVSNWQGPMWVLPNALAVRCLVKYGYQKQAEDISFRVVNTMSKNLTDTGTLFENYNAETGQPLWAPDFMSWNILALELIEILE